MFRVVRQSSMRFALCSTLLVGAGCQPELEWDEVNPPGPTLRRLTQDQYINSIHDLFGSNIVVPSQLEPDGVVAGLKEVGASVTTISYRGVEQYEQAAYSIAEQIVADEQLHQQWVPCTPSATVDSECAETSIEALGRRLWRRPLSDDERSTLTSLANTAAQTLNSFDQGLVYSFSAMLQSPHFLFRVELGEPDPEHPGALRYTSHEMATRLSYFLWNSTPDEELLAAAEAGELTTEAGLLSQVERLLEHPNSRRGMRAFFNDLYKLYKLDELAQDPSLFTHMSPDVGPSAREETLAGIEALIFEDDADFRDLLTTRRTSLNRTLAAIYLSLIHI